jgi:hypothetical protein
LEKGDRLNVKPLVIIIVTALGLAFAVTATAAPTSLVMIGKASSSGDFAVAAASGKKRNTHAVYLRGYGRKLSGYAVVACSRGYSVGAKSTRIRSMASGRSYQVRLPFPGSCDVTASLSGSGRIRLQILAA